ncbi:MAG: hypothetical protein V4536_01960 [Pseudomonadota bacterium]
MSDKLIASKSTITTKQIRGNATEGEISKKIGTGENARNSIVWITIRWSLIAGGLITLALYLRSFSCEVAGYGNFVEDIKTVWAIFLPLITLALGYTFGKGR